MADRHPELPLDPDVSAAGAPPARPRRRTVTPAGLALVAAGGAVGTLARYGLGRLEPAGAGEWPWATFAVNVVGALLLGVLLEVLARRGPDAGRRKGLRLLLGTGFCGGLTTYSTLAVEADLLVRAHRPGVALGYLAASIVTGLLAAAVGIAAGTLHRRAGS